MCKLYKALAISEMVAVGEGFWRIVAHEVKIEFSLRLFDLLNHLHAEMFIKLHWKLLELLFKGGAAERQTGLLWVLHANPAHKISIALVVSLSCS